MGKQGYPQNIWNLSANTGRKETHHLDFLLNTMSEQVNRKLILVELPEGLMLH